MTPYRLPRGRILAVACVLVGAGLSQAAAQFPPPPGQTARCTAAQPPRAVQHFRRLRARVRLQRAGSRVSARLRARLGADRHHGRSLRGGGFGPPGGGGFASPGRRWRIWRPAAPGPSEAQKVCLTFPALREDVEKGAAVIKAASARKASREEVCPLFKSFAAKEAKMVTFLETNQKLCGVPPKIITQVKTNHAAHDPHSQHRVQRRARRSGCRTDA